MSSSNRRFTRKKKRFYGNQFTKLWSPEKIQHLKLPKQGGTSKTVQKPDILRAVKKADSYKQTKVVDTNNYEDTLKDDEKPSTSKVFQDTDTFQNVDDYEPIKGFNWRPYLRKTKFSAAPVSCFKHVAFSNCWDSIVSNVRVEVRSPDCKACCVSTPCKYWLATVIKVCGYWGLLRYDGFDKVSPHYFNVPDRWVNLCTENHIHPIGWCRKNNKPLVPPKNVEQKIISWKEFLVETLIGGRTLPSDFTFQIEESSLNTIKKGMRLEVVDKNLISVVRSAIVTDVVGGRLHIKYAETETEDEGFWCHERSSLIHPVGWAQIIGHALKARPEYARQSLKKTLYRTFEPNDATWDMFLPVYNPENKMQFKVGMKLEAIDPLNLSTICVATVTKVLRNNYLMIGIDGMMQPNGSDWFCYHASSPCIFPVGFCEIHDIKLTPPRGYKGDFRWSEYLKRTKAEAAPVNLFRTDIPDHGFQEGMYLEAVDLMEPRLICVAFVTKVVGRLLKVHFEGWEDDYDQWCDCESPDLFPIGWCDVLGYRLEPPRADYSEDKKKKKVIVKKRKRRQHWSKKPNSSEDSPNAPTNIDASKSNDGLDSKDSSRANSIAPDESSSNSFSDRKKPILKPTKSFVNSQKGKSKIAKRVQSITPGSDKANTSTEASGSFPEKKNLRGKRINYEETPVIQRIRTPQLRKAKTPAFITYAEDSSLSSDDE